MRGRVLIVEDDAPSAELLRAVLEYRGHEVRSASSVSTALACVDRETFDLALLDIRIPGGGGEHLLSRLRARPDTSQLPIVAVTAFAMTGDRERFLAQGFDGYVSKPIDTRRIAAYVDELLARAGPRSVAP